MKTVRFLGVLCIFDCFFLVFRRPLGATGTALNLPWIQKVTFFRRMLKLVT